MSRHFRRLVSVACALAVLATFIAVPAVPAGASGTGPATVNYTQNAGTVTVTWGGSYTVPTLGLYPSGTACPNATNPPSPNPSFSTDLSASTSPTIISLSTTGSAFGWGTGTTDLVRSGSYNFCMYNKFYEDNEKIDPFYTLVNVSGWVGTVTAAGPPGSSAPPGAPRPPGEEDPSSAPPAPQRVTPSFTG